MFVVIDYFPHSPVQVYGPFSTEGEAQAYVEAQHLGEDGGAYEVQEIRTPN